MMAQARTPTATVRRTDLRRALESSRDRLEEGILNRVRAVADTGSAVDPAYREGLRATVGIAIDYALEAIERGEQHTPPPPPALLAQARLAARTGVALDVVLRRYLAGYMLLGDFLSREAEGGNLPVRSMAELMPGRAAVFDRLLAAVSEEYEREVRARPGSTEEKRAERVERLLAGEPLDASDFAYDFDGHHLGVVAVGVAATETIRELSTSLEARLLTVRRSADTVWAWLGSRDRLDPAELTDTLSIERRPCVRVAVGEPGRAISGWRLSHRQARATLPLLQRSGESFARYGDVAVLVSAMGDDLLRDSLSELYLTPLSETSRGGEVLRLTLRAYFAADRNAASAAAALGISRQAVHGRLRAVEEALGRAVSACAVGLELALALEGMDERDDSSGVPHIGCHTASAGKSALST